MSFTEIFEEILGTQRVEVVDKLKEFGDQFEYTCKAFNGRPYVSRVYGGITFRCSEMKLKTREITANIFGDSLAFKIVPEEQIYIEPAFSVNTAGVPLKNADIAIIKNNGNIKYSVMLPVKAMTFILTVPVKVFSVTLTYTFYDRNISGLSITVFEEI